MMIWQDRNMSECFKVFLKLFYVKLYVHSLVDKLKWFYKNARCYNKISDMFRCYSYAIISERINLCLLKLQLLKQSIKIHRCVVHMVVVWLHSLTQSTAEQCNTNTPIRTQYMQPHHHLINHTPMYFNGPFNNCNFSKNELMRSLMMV